MNYVSLFSGIEAAHLALNNANVSNKCVGLFEIDGQTKVDRKDIIERTYRFYKVNMLNSIY